MPRHRCNEQTCFQIRVVTPDNQNILDIKELNIESLVVTLYFPGGKEEQHTITKNDLIVHCHILPTRVTFKANHKTDRTSFPEKWSEMKRAANYVGKEVLKKRGKSRKRPSSYTAAQEFARSNGWIHTTLSSEYFTIPLQAYDLYSENVIGKPKDYRGRSPDFGLDPNQPESALPHYRFHDSQMACFQEKSHYLYKYLIEVQPLLCYVPILHENPLWAAPPQNSPLSPYANLPCILGKKEYKDNAINNGLFALLAYQWYSCHENYSGPRASPGMNALSAVYYAHNMPEPTYEGSIYEFFTQLGRFKIPTVWNTNVLPRVQERPYEECFLPENVRFIHDEQTDTQNFSVWNPDTVIIAFRGTAELTDAQMDLTMPLISHPKSGPRSVHKGFQTAFLSVQGLIKHSYNNASGSGKRLFIAGHSLGGALATLCAAFLHDLHGGNPIWLYTYGSPRVGSTVFRDCLDALPIRHFRHMNNDDTVTHVPPPTFPFYSEEEMRNFIADPSRFYRNTLLERPERWAHHGQLYRYTSMGPCHWKLETEDASERVAKDIISIVDALTAIEWVRPMDYELRFENARSNYSFPIEYYRGGMGNHSMLQYLTRLDASE